MSQTQIDQPLVEFRNVSYGVAGMATPIISNLNLAVNRGETLVLLGESGCGKTTTLRLVNRLLLPTAGEVLVEGKSTSEWDPIALRRRTGYVIQEAGLFPHFTVERNVALVPTLEGWEGVRVRERVCEMLRPPEGRNHNGDERTFAQHGKAPHLVRLFTTHPMQH